MAETIASIIEDDEELRQRHLRSIFNKAIASAYDEAVKAGCILTKGDVLVIATFLQAKTLDTFVRVWPKEMTQGFLQEMIAEYEYPESEETVTTH